MTTTTKNPTVNAETPAADMPVLPKKMPEAPEALALVLMNVALSRPLEQRAELLDLFAECLGAVLGNRKNRVVH